MSLTEYGSVALLDAASTYALEAIHDYEECRWGLFPLHAGAAAEFAAKAALSQIDPLLLADSGGDLNKTLVRLSGRDDGVKSSEVRTVSLRDAVKRLVLVYPDFSLSQESIEALFKARNAAAHIGSGSDNSMRLLLVFFTTTTSLIARTRRPMTTFWGKYHDVAMAAGTISERDPQSDARMRIGLARARVRDHKEAAIRQARASAAASAVMGYHQEIVACPICGCDAIAEGEYDATNGDWRFAPLRMRCYGCELRISGPDATAIGDETVVAAFAPRAPSRSAEQLKGQRALFDEDSRAGGREAASSLSVVADSSTGM